MRIKRVCSYVYIRKWNNDTYSSCSKKGGRRDKGEKLRG
jgi:hypothetical protein